MEEYISRDKVLNIFSCDLAENDKKVSLQGICIDAAFKIMDIPAVEQQFTVGQDIWIVNEDANAHHAYKHGKVAEVRGELLSTKDKTTITVVSIVISVDGNEKSIFVPQCGLSSIYTTEQGAKNRIEHLNEEEK